jgi:PAS domain S-box-containing protein
VTVPRTERRENSDVARFRLAAILESTSDAFIAQSLDGLITDWNKGAENLFGYRKGEILGTPIGRLIPQDRYKEGDYILERIKRCEAVENVETLRQTRDGRLIHVSETVSPIQDKTGRVIGASKIVRDITKQKGYEHELARLTRLYSALGQVNHTIIWSATPEELFEKLCRILVEKGGFRMAWIGRYNPEKQEIVPVVSFGAELDYIQTVKIRGDDGPGCGPTGQAFRTGQPFVCNDMRHNPVMQPCRGQLAERGFQASASFPIQRGDEVWGVLSVYAEEPWFFLDKEVALLKETAEEISFALSNFAERAQQREAEQEAENERLFSATMTESMPGILYFYDEQGKFLRWNRNFEVVSGYSHEQIAQMRPQDFFSDEEKKLLTERISEVFEKGNHRSKRHLSRRTGTQRRISSPVAGFRSRIRPA